MLIKPSNYLLNFLLTFSRALIPSFLLGNALSIALPHLDGTLHVTTLYLIAWLAVAITQNQYSRYFQHREAARLGAVLAPELKGRWPGNFDLLIGYVTATAWKLDFPNIMPRIDW